MVRAMSWMSLDGATSRSHQGPPSKVAVIDVGSHSIHMVIAKIRKGGFRIVGRYREAVGLGYGTLVEGRLSPQVMAAGLRTLKAMAASAAREGVEYVVAVATSAILNAANGAEFIQSAQTELGVDVEKISGDSDERRIC